jgi:hypothetical protein
LAAAISDQPLPFLNVKDNAHEPHTTVPPPKAASTIWG